MRALWFVTLYVGLGTSFSVGQQAVPSTPPKPDSQPARVKVYAVGPGVTAPELFPLNLTGISSGTCKKKMDGKVVLSVLVDETGKPRNIMFLRPLGTDLDKFALQIAAADRFKPGTSDGAPVVVAQSVEVDLQACVDEKIDDAGKKTYLLRLRSQPAQKFSVLSQPPNEAVFTSDTISWNDIGSSTPRIEHVGGSVTAPVPLNSVEAHYTPEAKKAGIKGKCLVSFIVDQQGIPQKIRIIQSLDPGLDQNAMDSVVKYRFKPAMRNGEPVPVMLTVEVSFDLVPF
ncbi:MAG: energy transducer TonB [Terracidiphilus sp.]